jgi:8-oxo-dGTP diphosphatase
MTFTYEYQRPMVVTDIILTRKSNAEILLILRKKDPFKNQWALPGGFIEMEEELMDAALRELEEETGICLQHLEQFRTYGRPGRDPRGRTISVVFSAKAGEKINPVAGDDASQAAWFKIGNLPDLAFDHAEIILDYFRNEGKR